MKTCPVCKQRFMPVNFNHKYHAHCLPEAKKIYSRTYRKKHPRVRGYNIDTDEVLSLKRRMAHVKRRYVLGMEKLRLLLQAEQKKLK